MKVSYIGIIAAVLVVAAVALAGCSGSSPAAPAGGGAQAAGTQVTALSGGQTASSGGAGLFSGLNYNWVEYKMSTGSGSDAMIVYMKYDRTTGKCSMRFEGPAAANMPASMQNMDCSSRGGGQASADPNQVSTDAKIDCSPIPESVTVPAGTFSATKCTVTSQGYTSTMWVDKGRFMVKMEGSTEGGSTSMVLNAYG